MTIPKSLAWCWLLLCGLFPQILPAATLHAILVADTNDYLIGDSTKQDLRNLENLVNRISQQTGLTLQSVSLEGEQFTQAQVESALDKLTVANDDVVIFYYSGHGGRALNKTTRWPSLALNKKATGANSLFDFDNIIERLQQQRPRLVLAIADACNDVVPPPKDRGIPKIGEYRELFLNYQGHLIFASSKPGQKSAGTIKGGYFTNVWLASLNSETTWERIIKRSTVQIATGEGKVQTPQVIFDIKPVGASPSPPPSTSQLSNPSLRLTVLPGNEVSSGEVLRVQVQSAKAGQLVVWELDHTGQLTQIIPQAGEKRLIKAGQTVTIPENVYAGFQLVAGNTPGRNLFIAVVVEGRATQLPNPQTPLTESQLRELLTQRLGTNRWVMATVEYEVK